MKPDLLKTNQTLRRGIYNSAIIHKFFAWPIGAILLAGIFMAFGSCNKEIQEPEHKNDGSNVLYFNIDGKGYLIRDRCFDLPSRKTGDIYGGDDKGSLPRLKVITNTGIATYVLEISYDFNKEDKTRGNMGGITIIFYQKPDGSYYVREIYSDMLFYSPKAQKLVSIIDIDTKVPSILRIEKFDKEKSFISGNLYFLAKQFGSNESSTCYLYFDLKTNNS
jgi:hypothetical protein